MKRAGWLVTVLVGICVSFGVAQDFAWQELGEATFATCAGCHQMNGAGLPGIFPPLAGHVPNLVAAESSGEVAGREYLLNVLTFGLVGEITVLEGTYNGVMPPWGGSLKDEQIAAVLNYVLHAWENEASLPEDFAVILPEEVAAVREAGRSSEDVWQLRQALTLP